MEAVAMSVVPKPLDAKKEYLKALGRLGSCVHGTLWSLTAKGLARLQAALSAAETTRAALDRETLEDPQFFQAARRKVAPDGAAIAAFVHGLASLGHPDEAQRAITQLAIFDPPMRRIAEAAAAAPRTPKEAKDAFIDAAKDHDLPLRARLVALWWLSTLFEEKEFGDDLLLSLMAAALREGNWHSGKLVLGAARALLQRKTNERWSRGDERPPNFLQQYEEIPRDLASRDEDLYDPIPF